MIDLDISMKRKDFLLTANIKTNLKNIGLSGNSGVGKTTLLNIIAGIIKPDQGKVVVNNKIIFDSTNKINIPVYTRKIAYVFQNPALFPHLNILKNLEYGYKLIKEDEKKFFLNEIVEYFKINDLLKKYPHQISGGEKQRVAIARSILISPELILFDEPVNSLDDQIKEQIINYIKESTKLFNIPIIYVSHDKNEIRNLCDIFIVLTKTQQNNQSISTAYLKDKI